MSRTVPPECLANKTSTKCMVWDGKDYPELDIKKGDSLEWVLDKLVESLDGSGSATTAYDLSGLETSPVSDCAANITYHKVEMYDSVIGARSYFNWSADKIANSLPENYSVLGARVMLRDKDGVVFGTSRDKSSNVPITVDRYPITADYTLFVHTPCGTVNLSTVETVPSGVEKKEYGLKSNDIPSGNTKAVGVDQAIKMLATEIRYIKNRM